MTISSLRIFDTFDTNRCLQLALTPLVMALLTACGGGQGAQPSATASEGNASRATALAVTVSTAATVVINEVMSANFHGATDENGDQSDWVELYNTTAAPISLAGYGLSNKAGSPFRWVFPSGVSIGAKSYLRVWLSKKDRTASAANLHTNFNLDNGADEVILSAPNGTVLGAVVDNVTLPLMRQDVSYCRASNGVPSSAFSFCATPTPGAANNSTTAAATMLATPVISVASGLYSTVPPVTVSGPAGAQLRYTLDGSEPTTTSALYSAPLTIARSAALRVAAFQAGAAQSLVETATYVIETATRFQGQRVMFINMAPGDASTYKAGGRTTSGWASHIEMIDAQGQPAFRGNMGGFDSGQIGSRNGQNNVPLDIKFKDALGVKDITYPLFTAKPGMTKLKHLKLRNGGDDYWYAHLRDQFWQTLLDEKTAPGGASEPVQVFLNGQYYGMMDLREKEDETLIESTYGVDKDTVDYINQTKVLSGENAWANYTKMRDFMFTTDLSVPANHAQAQGMLDMENFAQDFALHMFAVDRDWLWRNMHFFRMPAYDGKWRFRPHDFDISSAGRNAWGYPTAATQNMNDYYGYNEGGVLMNRLLMSPAFKALYINVIADQMNSTLSPAATLNRLDKMTQAMQPYMAPHYAAFPAGGSMAQWTQSLATLKDFLNNRAISYDQHTRAKFALSARKSVQVSVNDPSMGTVKVNTISLTNKLSATSPTWTGLYYPEVPITLEARPRPGYVFVGWSGASTVNTARISAAIQADNTSYTALFALAGTVPAPVVTAVPAQINLTGDTVSYQVVAADPTQLPLTYSAKKLPSGLSIHPETGMIYGKPTKGGVFASTVTVTNGKTSQTLNVGWTINNRGDRVVTLPQTINGDGTGLQGSYFNNNALTGVPLITRTELPAVNLGAGTGPATGFGTSNWAIRWDGYLETAVAGTYSLQALINTDDGVRVFVDGSLVIDNWSTPSTVARQMGFVSLQANLKTPIRIEYWDASGAAKLQMNWKIPGETAYTPMSLGVFSTAP